MKLQPASRREIKRIAIGTAAFAAIQLGAFFLLSLLGTGTFDYRVFLGTLGGSIIAVINFTIMCLTIQKAVNIAEKKAMKAFIQGSYNGRLLLQAGWIVAAFLIPYVNVIAAALPLLFPNLTIFYLQSKGRLVTPSDRTDTPAEIPEDGEAPLGPFEV